MRHIWPEIRDFDRVRTEKGEILGFYRDFVGNYGNFGEIQAENRGNPMVPAKYVSTVSVGDTRFSERKWLYEPNIFLLLRIEPKIGQVVHSEILPPLSVSHVKRTSLTTHFLDFWLIPFEFPVLAYKPNFPNS